MHLLFPSDPFDKSTVDEAYAQERAAADAVGLSCSFFSFEDFESGRFRPRPAIGAGERVLYRGWMLTPQAYTRLHIALTAGGAEPHTSAQQYLLCHHLPQWYPLCSEFTPETVVVPVDADFVAALEGKDWPAYFVKDYVKSLTTARGSVAATAADVAQVVAQIAQYRGTVEGGVCIRRFEPLVAGSEQRYFVFNGRAHASAGEVPAVVDELSRRIHSAFFSVDVATAQDGRLRLIELGDGQVSDRKQWAAEQFVAMLDDGVPLSA